MTDHPINPSPELVRQWLGEYFGCTISSNELSDSERFLAAKAAQWGSDLQLEADAEWLDQYSLDAPHLTIIPTGKGLAEAMRPKQQTLKEQALSLIDKCTDPEGDYLDDNAMSIIRCALEALPDA